MQALSKKTTALLAIAGCAGAAFIAPTVASAKSYKVTMKVTKPYPQEGTTIRAIYSGKPFGKCTMKGELIIPNTKQTWKCKGGSFTLTAVGKTTVPKATGTWKVSKGTGKFKKIKASGKFSGSIATGIFTYSGKAKY